MAASSQVGALVNHSGVLYSVNVSSATENSITYTLSPAFGGRAVIHRAPFTAQPCNMLQLSDGLQIGWMVAAAWIAAYATLFIAKALRGETGNEYGNS